MAEACEHSEDAAKAAQVNILEKINSIAKLRASQMSATLPEHGLHFCAAEAAHSSAGLTF